LINNTGEHVLRFVPPLIIAQADIDRLIETLAQLFAKHHDAGVATH
jgi:acetylornithine/succinyldiaminopimelate/putrescine aminotransferase